MSWLGIYGHDEQRDALLRACRRDRLGHSYLFVGPDGIGKKRFALALAQTLSCETMAGKLSDEKVALPCGTCPTCLQIKAGAYPDLHVEGLPEEKQEFPIDLMRSIIDSLGVKPARPGSRRILIIDDADALNPESANCFLKTLEEPPPDSLLILLGTAAERQLDTIRSRCQVLVFRSLNKDDFAKAAVDAGLVASAAEAQALYPMAQGSLSLVEALKDPEMQRITGELAKALQAPKFASVAFGILLVKFCEGVKEAALKRQRARFAVSYLVQLFRAALVQAETGQTGQHPQQAAVNRLAGLANISAVPALIEACLETEHHIDRRFQLAMLLEAFADRLGKIL